MENTITAFLLKRYFAGTCTPAEQTLVEAWLSSHPDNAKQAMQWIEQSQEDNALFEELMKAQNEVWEKTAESLSQPQITAINEPYSIPGQQEVASRSQKGKLYWLQAAAVGVILLILIFAGFHFWNNRLVKVETKYGEVQSVKLPDGSVIHMNGNSKIAYKRVWTVQNREVWLDGEAFFTITHQANQQKYTVHLSGEIDIEVLGTEFKVSDRKSGKMIVLKSGKIKLFYGQDKTEKNMLLKPGELVKTKEDSPDIYKTIAQNPGLYYSWTSGKWLLNSTSLEEMLLRLKETYGITTAVEDKKLLTKKASGSIPLPAGDTQNAIVLVHDIASLFELTVEQRGNVIYLRKIQ